MNIDIIFLIPIPLRLNNTRWNCFSALSHYHAPYLVWFYVILQTKSFKYIARNIPSVWPSISKNGLLRFYFPMLLIVLQPSFGVYINMNAVSTIHLPALGTIRIIQLRFVASLVMCCFLVFPFSCAALGAFVIILRLRRQYSQ